MNNFFTKNISEIDRDKSLLWYGGLLSLIHTLTAYFWWEPSAGNVICWSFFPGCESYTSFFQSHKTVLLSVYFSTSLLSLTLFLSRKIKIAYWVFFFLTVLKFSYQLSNYRMMGNYHYMHHLINCLFLFSLYKKKIIKLFIVLFYLSAGMIKFNTDWMSGMALLRPSYFSGKLLEWACAYVIVLELFVSPFLLSKNKILKYSALVQFVIFHLFSWHIVGYFYPVLMLLIISIYILDNDDFDFNLSQGNWILIGIYTLAQLYPLLLERDSSLTGKGRILSLNMLDAKTVCETTVIVKYKDKYIEYNPKFSQYGVRIQCDPVVVVNKIHETCNEQSNAIDFIDIDLNHQVKRITSQDHVVSWSFNNVCRNPLKINWMGHLYQDNSDEK